MEHLFPGRRIPIFRVFGLMLMLGVWPLVAQQARPSLLSTQPVNLPVQAWFQLGGGEGERVIWGATADRMTVPGEDKADFLLPANPLRTVISPAGSRMVVMSRESLKDRASRLIFQVYNSAGEPLFAVEQAHEQDMPYPVIALFEDGRLVLGNAPEARLSFYGADGIFRETIVLLEKVSYDLERYLALAPATDGALADLIARRGVIPVDGPQAGVSQEGILRRFDKDRRQTGELTMADFNPSLLVGARDGAALALSAYTINSLGNISGKTLLLNRALQTELETEIFARQLAFAENGNCVAILGDKELQMLDRRSGEALWSRTVNASGTVAAIKAGNRGEAFLLNAESGFTESGFRYFNPAVQVVAPDGEMAAWEAGERTFTNPALFWDEETRRLSAGFSTELVTLEVAR